MKKLFAALLLTVLIGGFAPAANAHEYDRDDDDMWLRYVAYAVHPVGVAVEYVALRPIHWVVSRPCLNVVFGHERTEDCNYNYFEFDCDDDDCKPVRKQYVRRAVCEDEEVDYRAQK